MNTQKTTQNPQKQHKTPAQSQTSTPSANTELPAFAKVGCSAHARATNTKKRSLASSSSSSTPHFSPTSDQSIAQYDQLPAKKQKLVADGLADMIMKRRNYRELKKKEAKVECQHLWSRFYALDTCTPQWDMQLTRYFRKFWVVLRACCAALVDVCMRSRPCATVLHVQFDKTSLDFRQEHKYDTVVVAGANSVVSFFY